MEGTAGKPLSRPIGARTAAALLTIGVLSVGLSACGSDSSSGGEGSTAVVKREAGFTSEAVALTVANGIPASSWVDPPENFHVTFTDGETTKLDLGESSTQSTIQTGDDAVSGEIDIDLGCGGSTIKFSTYKLGIDKPYIQVSILDDRVFPLSEGGRADTTFDEGDWDLPVVMERADDSSEKDKFTTDSTLTVVMKLTVADVVTETEEICG